MALRMSVDKGCPLTNRPPYLLNFGLDDDDDDEGVEVEGGGSLKSISKFNYKYKKCIIKLRNCDSFSQNGDRRVAKLTHSEETFSLLTANVKDKARLGPTVCPL